MTKESVSLRASTSRGVAIAAKEMDVDIWELR